MTSVIESWLNWSLCEFLLFFLFWAFYHSLLKFRVSPADRYLFLKLVFVLVPFIPLAASQISLLDFGSGTVPLVGSKMGSIHRLSAIPINTGHGSIAKVFGWAVCALFLAYVAISLLRLYRVLFSFIRLNSICEDAEPIVTDGCAWPVLLHRLKIPPATIGLLTPRILIPRQVYDSVSPEQLEMILKHEALHIERRDYLFNAIRAVIQAVLVFSPFTLLLARHFESDMEISCDDTLRSRNAVVPRKYGELLLQLVKDFSPRPELSYSGLFVSNSLITRRISAMKITSMKSKPILILSLFIAFSTLFGYGVSALGLDTAVNDVVSANAGAAKELRFKVWAKVESQAEKKSSKKEMKSQMALNYEEVGTLVLDSVEIRLTPHRKGDSSELALQIWDQRQQQVIYESVAPMVDSAEVEFEAKLAPADGALFRFHVMLSRIVKNTATHDLLHHKITIEAKNMPVGLLLKQVSKAHQFDLQLGDDFPSSKKLGVISLKNALLYQLLDLVASGTHSQWSADNSHEPLVIRFDAQVGPDGLPVVHGRGQ